MKNVIKLSALVFILLHGISLTSAQEMDPPKSWIAGGSLNFISQLNDGPITIFDRYGGISFFTLSGGEETHNASFNFTPYVGKEISRHWTLGIQLQYGIDRYLAEDVITIPIGQAADTVDLKRNVNQYGIGVFGRYVFNPDQKFMVFLQPYIGFSFGDRVNLQDEVENFREETTSFGGGASLGLLYELSEKFRLTSGMGLIGYTTGTSLQPISGEENNFSNFSANLNLSSLYFGFEFKF